jgi:hypothetical protein
MYLMLKDEGVINSMREFRHLTIGQLRFFIRKNDEYEARKKKNKELNARLNAKQR